jgi:hypothetical protein
MRVGVYSETDNFLNNFACEVVKLNMPAVQVQRSFTYPESGDTGNRFSGIVSKSWGIPENESHRDFISIEKMESFNPNFVINIGLSSKLPLDKFQRILSISESEIREGDLSLNFNNLKDLTKADFTSFLAKFSVNLLKQLNYDHKNTALHKITAFTPLGPSDMNLALSMAQLERRIQDAILIDADIRAHSDEFVTEIGLEIVKYNLKILSSLLPRKISGNQILMSANQMNYPEKLFLRDNWRKFIQDLAEVAPVVVITSPKFSSKGVMADCYLSTYFADVHNVISC